jgi:hypothetical protein
MNRFLSASLSGVVATIGAMTLVMTSGCASSATAQNTEHTKPSAAPVVQPIKDPIALTELKKMGDALSSAKSMSFWTNTMTPIRGANNQWVHVFSTAKVSMKRPNKIVIETGGDAFPQKIYFDGKTFSTVSPEKKLYSQTAMPGTIDQMLAQASKAGEAFSFADVLIADPLTSWTTDLEGATYIGKSDRNGEKLQHLALTAKDVDWEVWIDVKTHLPRVVYVKYTGETRSPTVLIEFSKWKVNGSISDSTFSYKAPKDFKKIELKMPEEGASK